MHAAILGLSADSKTSGPAWLQVLQGVRDEVREHLADRGGIRHDGGQRTDGHLRSAALDRLAQRQERRVDEGLDIDGLVPELLLAGARQQEERIDQSLKLGRARADVSQCTMDVLFEDRLDELLAGLGQWRRLKDRLELLAAA